MTGSPYVGACHKACPIPKDADLQTELVEKMECHDKCGDDRACHRACGCPFQQLREKCPMLNMEEHVEHDVLPGHRAEPRHADGHSRLTLISTG